MDRWILSEVHRRREELHAYAARARQIRAIESGRSSSIRGVIADGVQAVSDALEQFAQVVREHEASRHVTD